MIVVGYPPCFKFMTTARTNSLIWDTMKKRGVSNETACYLSQWIWTTRYILKNKNECSDPVREQVGFTKGTIYDDKSWEALFGPTRERLSLR
jgi:hypothetical protein